MHHMTFVYVKSKQSIWSYFNPFSCFSVVTEGGQESSYATSIPQTLGPSPPGWSRRSWGSETTRVGVVWEWEWYVGMVGGRLCGAECTTRGTDPSVQKDRNDSIEGGWRGTGSLASTQDCRDNPPRGTTFSDLEGNGDKPFGKS